jgi:hypothetical protein
MEYFVDAAGLRYSVLIFKFTNGYFVAISKGKEHKLGVLGIATPSNVITPLKADIYTRMLSQRIADMTDKMCIVSINAKDIDAVNMKKIIDSIMERIR